jgi:hypothetical protein
LRVRLEIPVNVEQMADGALRLEGKTTVSRKAAGVAWNKLGMIRDDAMLDVQLTGIREIVRSTEHPSTFTA